MPPRLEDLLFALEERFWKQGADYFRRFLADDAMMVFPHTVLVSDQIPASVRDARWSDVQLEEHRLVELDERAAIISYKATARRRDGSRYVARASSAYVSDGRTWKLAFHQQTPVA